MISQSYNNYQNFQDYKGHNKINYREPQVDNIPGPNFEYPDLCLLNVSKSVCKLRIDTNHGSFGGSGFFLKFLINGKLYFWLVSNEHVITKEMIKNKSMVNVSFNIENKDINIKLEQSERYIKTFKDYKVDATVIQIRSKDNIYEDYFLEPELGYDNNKLIGKEIFIPQFPSFKQLANSRGIIKEISHINPNEFTHLAKTQKGSSGSPIFLKGNKRVIGIHKEGNPILKENYGDFIAPIISILTTDIMIRLNIVKINNNKFLNSQENFGSVNPNPNNNSNSIVGAAYPINQIKPINQINQNMKNNKIALPGNLNNFNAFNGNNKIDPSRYLQHVERLKNALNGVGVDEGDIVKVIASTTNPERVLIRRLYIQKYNEDLVDKLQSELTGDFKAAAVGSFMTPTEYDAYCLNYAMKGLGTDDSVLIEIIGSRTPEELKKIKEVYFAIYGETIENAIAGDTSGDYRELLLALLQCQRSQSPVAYPNGCARDAAALYQAVRGLGVDITPFTKIFATRSPADLALINQYFKQHAGKGLLGVIDDEFSGNIKDLLDTILRSNVDPYGYYAGRIHDSFSGLATNDLQLIRNICARHSVDLPKIKQAYIRDYGTDMLKDIEYETSGHYIKILSSLVTNAR